MQLKERTLGSALVILAAVLAGCSSSELVSVSGTVTYDGRPLESGRVTFVPADGQGAVGYGSIQSNGSYEVQSGTSAGVLPGLYRVTVAAEGPMPQPTAESPEPLPESLIPTEYRSVKTSGLQYTVSASGGRFDIVLTSESTSPSTEPRLGLKY